MGNQIGIDNQNNNTPQMEQNSIVAMSTKKPKTNYALIVGIALACAVFFGLGGYYFGKQSLNTSDESKQTPPTPSSIITQGNAVLELETYKNSQYGIEFDYPQNYTVSTGSPGSDCSLVTSNQSGCLVFLTLNPTGSDYPPKASFWFLKGINSINISGQISSINFDAQKKAWVLDSPDSTPQVLSVWGQTKSGQEIIKAANGGSHGSFDYYIIPNYENDEVAIFSIPSSYRLRCDNFVNDRSKETDCNNFYKSVIDQYNNGEVNVDSWLPKNYLDSLYAEAEDIVKSYRQIINK